MNQADEIIVVDDSSSEDILPYLIDFPTVKYIRVEHRNPFLARRSGFIVSSGKYIIFLDGDDKLSETYVQDCIEHLETYPTIGVVTTGMRLFGDKNSDFTPKMRNIQQHNWLHCASMVRRTAIMSSEIFDQPDKIPPLHTCEDWYLWRCITNAGWAIGRIDTAQLFYRQHGPTLNSVVQTKPYFERALLEFEPVTLVIPYCRTAYFDRLKAWIQRNSGNFTHILVINSSGNALQASELLLHSTIPNVSLVHMPDTTTLVDAPRTEESGNYDPVQQTMTRIYKHLRNVTTEYMLIVEDDVLPPDDVCTSLLHRMDHDVAAVTAVVPSRTNSERIIAGINGRMLQNTSTKQVQNVDFSGFGCLLLRKSVVKQAPPVQYTDNVPFDLDFFNRVKSLNYRVVLDWTTRCVHGRK
jgi:hypothetical protein